MNDLTSKDICLRLAALSFVERAVVNEIDRLNLHSMIAASVAARRMRVLAWRAS